MVESPRARGVSFLPLILLVCALPAHAWAQEPQEPEAESAEGREMLLGAKVTQVNAFVDTQLGSEVEHGFGGGLFFETELLPRHLDLEVGLAIVDLPDADILELPFDVLLKLPFYFGESVELYLAVGLTAGPAFGPESTALQFGGAATAGSYVWLGERVGLEVEAEYALLREEGELVQELAFALGAVLRL